MTHRRTLLLAVALTAAGCGILEPGGGLRGELDDNRERWESLRPASYAVVVERLCFCGVEARGPVRVLVQGTIPTERTYTDSGVVVSAELAPFFPTIDGLFDVLADALDRDAHEVSVTYDEETGIPVDVWIDYEENTADEELGFAVTLPIDTDPGN